MDLGELGTWNDTNPPTRKYNFKLEEIPRLDYTDPVIDELIANNKPVVITNSTIVEVACSKWNLDYLEKNLGNAKHTVFLSKNYKFKYFDEKKIKNPDNPKGIEFTPPTRKCEMKISEFMKALKQWQDGDERLYLQQSLTSSVGPAVVDDFGKFDWRYVNTRQKVHNWGPLTSNLLFISQEGNVTPCHYDEQQNFFAQVQGTKQCILFPPNQFACLYPHPVFHPHDRQSQVNFDDPDLEKFPKFREAKGFQAIVNPGDVLYIPIYWWHQVESLLCGHSVSINFWYKDSPTCIEYPLKDYQRVSIMRNVEKMLIEVLEKPQEVGPLLRTMVSGRYPSE